MNELKTIISWTFKIIEKVFKIVRILFFVVAAYVVTISIFFHFISKEQAKYNSNKRFEKLMKDSYREFFSVYNKAPKEQKKALELLRLIHCSMGGNYCTKNPSESFNYFKQSLLGKTASLVALPYSAPPASGIAWTVNSLANVGIVPKALAAPIGGIGINALSPFFSIWSIFRDIAYLVLVLVLLTIGFLIMFRTKINPQTVISVENSLPKIIVSLVLVTFSFPIAGFLIDLMFIAVAFIIYLLDSAEATRLISKYTTGGFGSLFPESIGNVVNVLKAAVNLTQIIPLEIRTTTYFLAGIGGLVLGFKVLKRFKKSTGDAAKGGQGMAVGGLGLMLPGLAELAILLIDMLNISFLDSPPLIRGIGNFVIVLLLSLAIYLSIIFTMFRLFFLGFFTYINLLLNIIFSPLYMLLEGIPGKSGATTWIKNMLTELLTFPLIVAFLIISKKIINLDLSNSAPWSPPFLYGLRPNIITYLAGYAIFLQSPTLIKQIKKSLGEKPLFGISLKSLIYGGTAIVGGALGGIMALRSYSALLPKGAREALRKSNIGKLLVPPSTEEEIAQVIRGASGGGEDQQT